MHHVSKTLSQSYNKCNLNFQDMKVSALALPEAMPSLLTFRVAVNTESTSTGFHPWIGFGCITTSTSLVKTSNT